MSHPNAHWEGSRTKTRLRAVACNVPRKHINVARVSWAEYLFSTATCTSKSSIKWSLITYMYLGRQASQITMLTCRINKADQARRDATKRIEPVIGSLLRVGDTAVSLCSRDWWCGDQNMWRIGPLYNVISIAPPTDTIVPTIFAWLRNFLIFKRSILHKYGFPM